LIQTENELSEVEILLILAILTNCGLPGLKVAMRQMESTAPNTKDEVRDFFAKMF
jgi:hypothetical protein